MESPVSEALTGGAALSALAAAFPWIVVLIVYVGEKVQQWVMTHALNDALKRAQAQAPAAPVVVQQPAPKTDPAPAAGPPVAVPAPTAPAGDPDWLKKAIEQIGFHETGNNQGIDRYIAMAHCGQNGDPWCAIFENAMFEASGVPGTRSPSSQSFRTSPNFVKLERPARGAVAVFWRISKGSGQGHVGFYWGEDDTRVWTLGGNENDMVQIEALPKDSASFGLIDYWWPKSVPLPTTGPVIMPAGSPVSIKSSPGGSAQAPQSGVYSNIVATVFGGPKSAYGGAIDDSKPGVALPLHFEGQRPRVRVSKGGHSVDCDIVDVGPWNTNDPYWLSGARPQAESGTDMTGRKTNKAGIDLTVAAANAIQLDGKGLVSWAFIDAPNVT